MQEFVGENLWPGYLGQLFVIISFVATLLAAYGYWHSRHNPSDKPSYVKLANTSFILHLLTVIGVFATLFYVIFTHSFEYHYAWRHSSTNLPFKYILASFWEGSEGSFLLWTFWQALFGIVIILNKNELSSRVMFIVSIVQAILMTMVLGFYFGSDIKIGSSPFVLLRHVMTDAPIFAQSNYLSQIQDGNGLNPLLQNYWMVIHPPVLFMGFGLALFPFAFVLAALWDGKYKTFIKPTLRWSLATGAFLGLGIMMGGAWAYESLTFGGYWAWDPVENASLVPWMIFVAGLHTLVVYKSTGRSLKISLIFLALGYLFVWYSTFLTRTGVLGETSVHAFTDSGKALYYHLLVVLFILIISVVGLLVWRWKKMPKIAGEEESTSREFWMLIGTIVLLLSALFIIFYTSLPVWSGVWKAITSSDIAPPADPIAFYNKQQIWFAIVIALLSAAIQFLKYKKSQLGAIWKRLGLLFIVAALITVLLVVVQEVKGVALIMYSFAAIFAIVANVFYIVSIQKFNIKKAGGAITHLAFGLMLLSILFSSYKKEVISLDRTGQVYDFGKETFQDNLKESRENVLLFRNAPIPMGKYMVTYLGDSTVNNDPPITYFKLRFDKRNLETNELEEQFFLYPNVFINKEGTQGMGSNPDSRHYWNRDVFTYISSSSDKNAQKDSTSLRPFVVKTGDTIFLQNGYVVFEGLYKDEANPSEAKANAKLSVYDVNNKLGEMSPSFIVDGNSIINPSDTLSDLGLISKINKIDPATESVEIGLRQKAQEDDFVVIKVIVYPFIGLLWFSIVLMFLGFIISWWQRRR